MKIQTVLYYRYLFRQTIPLLITSFVIALVISLVLFLVKEGLIYIIVGAIIWLLPIFFAITLIVLFFKYRKYKQQLKSNIQIFQMISNKKIREIVVRSGKKIKIIFPTKNQHNVFFEIINPEIEKQKTILRITNNQNR